MSSSAIDPVQYPAMVLGHCPRCGMPILMDSGPYWSVLPPAPRRTCGCFASDVITTDHTIPRGTV